MGMTLLALTQEFCGRTGLQKPTYVNGNTDPQIAQIMGLLNEVLEELVDRWKWQELTYESVFTSSGVPDQGDLANLAPNGFIAVANDTIFDRTQRIEIFGPLNNTEWQARQMLPATGPLYQYRIFRNHLWFNPAVAVGHTIAFEYKSSWAVLSSSGAGQTYFAADDDTCLFQDKLLLASLRWRWKKEKGLEYAEDFNTYEQLAIQASGENGTRRTLSMSGDPKDFRPGIMVPLGNWNQ